MLLELTQVCGFVFVCVQKVNGGVQKNVRLDLFGLLAL